MQTNEEHSTAINESYADTTLVNQEADHEQQPEAAPAEEVHEEAQVEADNTEKQEEPAVEEQKVDERKPYQIFNSKLGTDYKFQLRGEATKIVKTQLETQIDFKSLYRDVQESQEQKDRRRALENCIKNIFTDEQFKEKQCYNGHVLKPKSLKSFKDGLEDKRCYNCGGQFVSSDSTSETTQSKKSNAVKGDDDNFIRFGDEEDEESTKQSTKHEDDYIMLHCDDPQCKDIFYTFCKNCLLRESEKLKIEDKPQPLAFSKFPFKRMMGRGERWACSSIYLKGNNVPKEHCKCLMGLTPAISQKEFDSKCLGRIEYVKASDSELRFCQACYNLWKQYEFDKELDYTQFNLPASKIGKEKTQTEVVEKEASKKSMKKSRIFKTHADKDDQGCETIFQRMETLDQSNGKSGQDMLQLVVEQFAQNSLVKTLSKSQCSIQGFNLVKDKHLKAFPQCHRAKWEDISHTDSSGFQMKKCEFDGGYRIVVQAMENVYFKEGSFYFNASTLRIFDPSDNLKLKDSIILQTFKKSLNINTEDLTSFLQFKNFLFYFKRIWVSSEDAQPKTEEQPKEDEQQQESPTDQDIGGDATEIGKKEEEKQEEKQEETKAEEGSGQEKTGEQVATEAPKANNEQEYSYLQLYMYNLETFKEKPLQNFAILEEFGHYWAKFNTNFGDCFMVYSSNENLNRKIYGNLEEAIKVLTEEYKKDQGNNAKIVDLNTQKEVFYIGNEFYYINQYIEEDGFTALSTYNSNNFTEAFDDLPEQTEGTVTKETIQSFEPNYRLEKFFKANYFLLYKVCDFQIDDETILNQLKELKGKCFGGYEDCKDQALEIVKSEDQYSYYCYNCYNYREFKFRCPKCETARCHLCMQKQLQAEQSNTENKPREKNMVKYNFIYRLDKPSQYVKYYQFDTSVPNMFFKSVEAVQGQFKERHNYPNLKMNNKAEFKDKKDDKKTKDPPNQVEQAQSQQDASKINFRNVLIVKDSAYVFLRTFHYPNEQVVQAPHEIKASKQAEEKAKQEEIAKKEEVAQTEESNEPESKLKNQITKSAALLEQLKEDEQEGEGEQIADEAEKKEEVEETEKKEEDAGEEEKKEEDSKPEEPEHKEEDKLVEEAAPAEGQQEVQVQEPELSESDIKELELKHQGFVKCLRYIYNLDQFKAEIWGVKVQNCKLPNQEETCTYTQYVFQNASGSPYLLYPQFEDDQKLAAGDGDCTTARSYVDYLQDKAAKQTQDHSFRASLLTNARFICEKLQKDFDIRDSYTYNFDYYESNLYHDLIWQNSEETFTITILQMNLQNQIYDDNFYKKPQIGTKINPDTEKFNGEMLWDLMNDNKGQVNYLNSVFKNLLYRNQDIAYKVTDDEGNLKYIEESLSQYEKVYIEGPKGILIPFDIVEVVNKVKDNDLDKDNDLKTKVGTVNVDPKDKENDLDKDNDLKTKVGTVNVKFMARTEKTIWFVLQVKDQFWMLLHKPLDFIKEDQTAGILNKNSEVHVLQNIKNQEVVFKKFKIDEFMSQKKDELEKYLNNNLIFEEWVDNRYKFTTLSMIYFHTNSKTYERECMSILTVDLDEKDQLKTQMLKMQSKQKLMSYLYPDDMKFQRITDRTPFKDGFKTQYAMINLFYSVQQHHTYEFEVTEISENLEQERQKNIYINVIRKSLTMLCPKLAKKSYDYKTYYNYLFPIFDEAQLTQLGYARMNRGYYDVGTVVTPTFKNVKEIQSKYETDIMYLDCRKICRKGFGLDEYFLYLDAQFKPNINELNQFDTYDQKHMLDHALYSMFHMVPFSFKQYLRQTDSKLNINQTSLFKKREELFGNTLSEIFVKEIKIITQALISDTSVNSYDNSLAEDMYASSATEELDELKAIDHFKGNSVYFVQCNFVQENILNRAIGEKAFKTASLILDHIFSLEGRNVYQIEIMKALPVILSEDRIASKIVRFFNLPDYDDKQENTLSFEQLLIEENTPAFSTEQWFVHETQTFDYNNYKQELVLQLNDIADKRSKELQEKRKAEADETKNAAANDDDDEILYDVKNTFIDFRAMICAMKFQEFKKTGEYVVKFDNYSLSSMVENMSSNKAFYNCVSVQRLIDHHFSQSKSKLERQVTLFVVGYYLPYMISLFVVNDQYVWRILLDIVSLVTICYFFSIELIQIRMDGVMDYVSGSGIWNFFDFTQFLGYLLFFIINCAAGFQFKDGNKEESDQSPSQDKPTFLVILQSYLIMTGFMKLLFFMRLDAEYGALVMMVQSTVSSVGPFIKFFYLWIIFFTFMYYNLALEIDTTKDDYANLNRFVAYFMMTYRDSVGDISPPGYSSWADPASKQVNSYIMYTIWITWLLNQFMCLIVMLNFLIAVISQVYDQVVAQQATILYLNRASLNKEYFQIQSFYNKTSMFGVLVFQIEVKDNTEGEDDDSLVGFVQTIKNFIMRQNGAINKKFDALNQQIIDSQNNLSASMATKMKNIEIEMTKNHAELIKQIAALQPEKSDHKVAKHMWSKVSHVESQQEK